MANPSGRSHVYVGAAREFGAARPSRPPGGLFRWIVGQGGLEGLTKGLPEPVDVQAITVHPTNPDVI
jgi:hypothetical protein